MIRLAMLLGLVVTTAVSAAPPAGRVFPPSAIADWTHHSFDGRTEYRQVTLADHPALRATAEASASARYHEVEVDLDKTPYLEWSWQVEALPGGDADERTRAGDDYAARVYVVREGLFGRLSARALNYVWSRAEPVGSRWPSAFTERTRMIAVASGAAGKGRWRHYRRDLRADWQAAFGEPIDHIDGIAIMTDSDNSASRARAFYGTIRFVGDEQ